MLKKLLKLFKKTNSPPSSTIVYISTDLNIGFGKEK